jgi:hypothetical protein
MTRVVFPGGITVPIVKGPKSKPIRTGAILYSICVTSSLLKYGGKTGKDINK